MTCIDIWFSKALLTFGTSPYNYTSWSNPPTDLRKNTNLRQCIWLDCSSENTLRLSRKSRNALLESKYWVSKVVVERIKSQKTLYCKKHKGKNIFTLVKAAVTTYSALLLAQQLQLLMWGKKQWYSCWFYTALFIRNSANPWINTQTTIKAESKFLELYQG